jgi:16S rRNA (cytosine1402-N4)-methyltransferase
VLRDEVVHWLQPREGSVLADGTAGAGGHSRALAELVGPNGHVIGLDLDPAMLALAAMTTAGLPVTLVKADYSHLPDVLDEQGHALGTLNGVLLDLGLSSDQLAWSERGFSFAVDGPLDMRFDAESESLTAADLIHGLPEQELTRIFFEYGEERHSRRVARNIANVRKREPITTTGQLAAIVRRSIPGKWGPIDPATRVFQALRIAVNHELEHLDLALAFIPDLLRPGGRVAIISFHSLEDRRVKHAFKDDRRLNVLTRKPITASPEEVSQNPRARSAKMRVAERCPNPTPPGQMKTPPPHRIRQGKVS